MTSDTMVIVAEAYPIVRLQPEYMHRTSWAAHIPFAMLLADLLRPSCFVELGTYYGVSYMAFCQAFKTIGVRPACTAVDTWAGDAQIGWYGDDVLDTLRKEHDPAYGDFSSLMRATFDQAVGRFADGSVDLLHIDGCHTYDAVRHDFETWLPKVSDRGVVLFHDTSERNDEMDFGVWRLWGELTVRYPHFEFTHEHGLGVLGVGREYPAALDVFFKASPLAQQSLRWQFCELALPVKEAQIGAAAAGPLELVETLRTQVQQLERLGAGQAALIGQLRQQVATLELHGAGLEAHRDQLQDQLEGADSRPSTDPAVGPDPPRLAIVPEELAQARQSAEAAESAVRRVERERIQLYSHVNLLQQQVANLTTELNGRRGLRGIVSALRSALRLRA